jgi:anti-sigma B factor antagonist
MKIERAMENGITVVTVNGVIKLGESARQFSSYLQGILDEDGGPLLVDMNGIDYVDSTGIGELVGYLQRFADEGRSVRPACGPTQRVRNLLKLTRLDEVFTDLRRSRTSPSSELSA